MHAVAIVVSILLVRIPCFGLRSVLREYVLRDGVQVLAALLLCVVIVVVIIVMMIIIVAIVSRTVVK